ncbi:hypothetical protein H0A36_25450 [Endozoicomonas sp. SM1973]|uniref:Uncharacterized protein n=1 Tax=Spartinivicinus marinus TaxID=2994442 RepID=A0A853I929_9GAMM|nr:DUF6880 family protein [Spartinivicinus marinus]MCX4026842.1 hypothetical protein [Spartinivicinus marinus]NYZ69369.1 hypothetical protein [Spartinivicinus marinus]
MKKEQLIAQLKQLNATELADFVISLLGEDRALDLRIESLALRSNPEGLTRQVKSQIQSIKRGRRFIEYGESFQLASRLAALIDDIEQVILPYSPKNAFELTDLLLFIHGSVMNRVDDSGGVVGGEFLRANVLWLKAAKAWGNESIDWLTKIYDLVAQEDYGVLDALLPNTHILLNEQQLKQLAWRYENEIRQQFKKEGTSNTTSRPTFELIKLSSKLHQVAEALADPELYEHATLLLSAMPNSLQIKSIVEQYVLFNQPKKALKWLDKPWQADELTRLQLLNKVYELMNDKPKLREVREQIYQTTQTAEALNELIELLHEEEKQLVLAKAVDEAEQCQTLYIAVDKLLYLKQYEKAQNLVLSRLDELARTFYSRLTDYVKVFEKQHCLLAVVACYRVLTNDILDNARSKAYSHAARYMKKLIELDNQIKNYQSLETAEQYYQTLQELHGRKRSFWSKISD